VELPLELEVPLELGALGEIRAPAGDTPNQLPPNAVMPSPFVSPAFWSLEKR
jgi:hypothetical protein